MSARTGNAVSTERLTVRGHALVLGVILFLASELMFFAAWFAAYFDLRGRSGQWPPAGVVLDPVEPSFGTALLGISSLFVFLAIRDVHAHRRTRARLWLTGTLLFGVLFLAETFHGWSKNTFTLTSHAYGSVFYGMTGFHAAHVTAGVIMLAFLTAGVDKPGFTQERAAGAEAISYYWHFVFAVWVGLWATIYFVR